MSDLITDLYHSVIILAAFGVLGWMLGYGFRRGQNAATKHLRVCDSCFRDIQVVNDALKRAKK